MDSKTRSFAALDGRSMQLAQQSTARFAVLAPTFSRLNELEQLLIRLIDEGYTHILAMEGAIHDVQAVLRARTMRFPESVPAHEPGYEDFVFASVMARMNKGPPIELARSHRLHDALYFLYQPSVLRFGQWHCAVGDVAAEDVQLSISLRGSQMGLDQQGLPARACLGPTGPLEGERASVLGLRALASGLELLFLGMDGQPLKPPQVIRPS